MPTKWHPRRRSLGSTAVRVSNPRRLRWSGRAVILWRRRSTASRSAAARGKPVCDSLLHEPAVSNPLASVRGGVVTTRALSVPTIDFIAIPEDVRIEDVFLRLTGRSLVE